MSFNWIKSSKKISATKDCKHMTKDDWKTVMEAIGNPEDIISVVLIDYFNAQPFYVPTHDFQYDYSYNEYKDSSPIFFEEQQYVKWLREKLQKKTFLLRIHVCDPMEVFRKVLLKFKGLTRISVHFFILNNNCIKFLVNNFVDLEAINFENTIGIKLEECLLLTKLSKLKHLNLMGSDIYEHSLEVILKNCPQLISLNISNNSGITGHCLTLITKSIKRLDLRDCWRIDSQRIIAMVRLSLTSLVEFLANSCINDESLNEICDNCPNIRHLTISFDYFSYNDIYGRRILSDSGFSAIGKLKHLRTLNIRHVGKLSDKSLTNILSGCTNLVNLVLNVRHRHKLTDNVMSKIGILCPKLETFESVHNHFIGPASVIAISKIENLMSLVLRGNTMVDNTITQVISNCKKLVYLNLDGCNVNELVLRACIEKAEKLQSTQQLFKVSLISTNIDRSALNQNVLPQNLRIKASGQNNYKYFSEFDGKNVKLGKLDRVFPEYWTDYN